LPASRHDLDMKVTISMARSGENAFASAV